MGGLIWLLVFGLNGNYHLLLVEATLKRNTVDFVMLNQ